MTYARRRDANEPQLVDAMRRIGLKVFYTSELGDCIVQYGKQTRLIEIKTETGTYTDAQCKRKQAGLITHELRKIDDVVELRRQMADELTRLARNK